MKRRPTLRVDKLDDRITPSVTSTTTVVKIPGPTDAVVTTATNPAGHHPPGQQSIDILSNRDARRL
jgi:hypothetical protein